MFSLDPSWFLDPYPWYAAMRRNSPILQDRDAGLWSVFRHGDVERVLSDYRRFSSRFGVYEGSGEPMSPIASSLIVTDPPDHTKLRTIVSGAFTARAIANLEPRIRAITKDLFDRVAPRGSMDVLADLAEPLPLTVIAEMLGIPPEDRGAFKRWSDVIVSVSDQLGGGDGDAVRVQEEASRYFLEVIRRRRESPGNDLISVVVRAEVDGQRLSDRDILGFCILLLVAGNETTTNLIGNAMQCFLDHPEAVARLRREPRLMPSAVEEVLRYRSPVRGMFRIASEDVRLDGTTIRTGDSVLAWIGSANRDESVFSDADRFDMGRTPNPHIAFGHGIHQCLGAPLARLEGRIALDALFARCKDFAREAPGEPLEPLPSLIVQGVRHLPITFEPEAA